ncbi:capsular polysaccharide synthesis protein [Pectobacterium odoriferum]|uniref:glycosyltransferase family 32 protein n=1 Tax=Pectobacterium TaxID=122277 RepID=UPI000CD1F340|nr:MULTISPECIES: capsular polysaccharide synthesis protein [Pectobacterium]POE22083.1 hypothetical protein BV923_11405 [Pectobacterium odoriferum]
MNVYIIGKKILNTIKLFVLNKPNSYQCNDEKYIEIYNDEAVRVDTPKIIWMYWHDDNIPTFVYLCINRIKNINPDFDVKLISSNNINYYIPNLNFYRKDLSFQLKADIIRLELLYHYGGIWLDASILFFENLSWVTKLVEKNKYDFIGFYRARLTNNFKRPIIENWMLCSPPKNIFIKKWLDNFKPAMDMGLVDYHNSLQRRFDYLEIKQNINIPEYLSAYLAAQIAIKDFPQFNAYLRCAETSAYLYQETYPQRDYFLSKVWCELERPKNLPPLIKLTSQNRNTINSCTKINPNSIIGFIFNGNNE